MANNQVFNVTPIPAALLGNGTPSNSLAGNSYGSIDANASTNLAGTNPNNNPLFSSAPLSLTPARSYQGLINVNTPTIQVSNGIDGSSKTVPNPIFTASPATSTTSVANANNKYVKPDPSSVNTPVNANTSQTAPTAPPGSYDVNNGVYTPANNQVTVPTDANGQPLSATDMFNNQVIQMLQTATGASNNANQALTQQGQNLTQEALTQSDLANGLGNQSLFNGAAGPARLAVSQALENSYQPGILSDTNQQAVNNQALANATSAVNSTISAEKPIATGISDNLVTPGGTTVSQGFNPTTNINTGMPYGYAGNTTAANNATVAGINFGDARSTGGLGAYSATQDPAQYASAVAQNASAIQQLANGQPVSAGVLDQYIGQQTAGKSPITGQMIMNAAQQYGVDPSALAGVLSHESTFGTAGKAVNTNNPGNQMPGGVEATYPTMQQGVDATAANLAQRMNENQNAATGNTSNAPVTKDPYGSQINPTFSTAVSQLPSSLTSHVEAGPSGIAYLNGDQINSVSPGLSALANIAAPKAGVPVLDSGDIATLSNVNGIVQSLNSMQALIAQNLSSGGGSSVAGGAIDKANTTINSIFGNNPSLSKFNSYIASISSAAGVLKTLSGGSGSGLRITGAELGTTFANLPTTSDSLQSAQQKISALNLQISQWMHGYFPQVSATEPVTPTLQAGQNYTMVGQNGDSWSIPASQVQTAVDNGYYINNT